MASVVVATQTERLIINTLSKIIPATAASYEQCMLDLGGAPRRSYRGVAHELREVLRETLDHLAPDADVMAGANFKLEKDTKRPTHRQKALYVLRKRQLSAEAMTAPDLAVSLVEELGAKIARSTYSLGSASAHSVTSGQQVRQLKLYVDAVLAELLEIHAQPVQRRFTPRRRSIHVFPVRRIAVRSREE
jgi:Predicted pPIWI-associating nuclease